MSDTTTTYEKCLAFRMSLTVPEWEAMIERGARQHSADGGFLHWERQPEESKIYHRNRAESVLRAALEVIDEQ